MTFYVVGGRFPVNNTNAVERRLQLEQQEQELHDQLTEDTRRLQMARAQVKHYEEIMERTLKELHEVRQQKTELTELLVTTWNGPGASQPQDSLNN
ncbi:MAG: hypothetical protein HC804_11705 [Anaerolineae bacterium]|nr:hypothetical protein [Anaerolineae bacterium]